MIRNKRRKRETIQSGRGREEMEDGVEERE